MIENVDVTDAITADLYHLKAALTTWSHAFGGECTRDERPNNPY
ncbi:hypothetical protein WAE61_10760 [Comamonadaceae bacterium PP-2]